MYFGKNKRWHVFLDDYRNSEWLIIICVLFICVGIVVGANYINRTIDDTESYVAKLASKREDSTGLTLLSVLNRELKEAYFNTQEYGVDALTISELNDIEAYTTDMLVELKQKLEYVNTGRDYSAWVSAVDETASNINAMYAASRMGVDTDDMFYDASVALSSRRVDILAYNLDHVPVWAYVIAMVCGVLNVVYIFVSHMIVVCDRKDHCVQVAWQGST